MTFFLNYLSANELDEFENYLKSHSPGTNNKRLAFFRYVKKFHPQIKREHITAEAISKGVFKGDMKIGKSYLQKIPSFLYSQYEDFVILNEIEKNPSLKDQILAGKFSSGEMFKLYESVRNKVVKELGNSFVTDKNFYYNLYKIEEGYFHMQHLNNSKNLIEHYESKTPILDYYLCFEKLKSFYDYVIVHSYIPKGVKVNKFFYDSVIKFAEEKIDDIRTHHPYIYLYYLLAKFYEKFDQKYYKLLLDYNEENKKRFTDELRFDYNDKLITIIAIMKNKGIGDIESHTRKIFEFNDRIFMQGEKHYKKHFRDFKSQNFIGAVNTAVRLKKADWALSFMEKYKYTMTDDLRKDAYNLGMAKVLTLTGKFNESIKHASRVSKAYPGHYYVSQILMARGYHELKELSRRDSVLENLKKYSKRSNKLNEQDVMALKNFITYFGKLIKITGKEHSPKELREMIHELKTQLTKLTTVMDSRIWILNQLSIIEGMEETNPRKEKRSLRRGK